MTARGRFITLEGGDGAGKSTHLQFIAQCLARRAVPCVQTREPGGTEAGERIRQLVLERGGPEIGGDAELLLIFAARMEHLRAVIRPALERGAWVLCDRFTDATYAYQGGGRGLAPERIAALEHWVQQGLQPDLTLLLDVPVAAGQSRVRARGGGTDRFEAQSAAFKEAVRAAYLRRAAAAPERIRVVDAARPLAAVRQQLQDILEAVMPPAAEAAAL